MRSASMSACNLQVSLIAVRIVGVNVRLNSVDVQLQLVVSSVAVSFILIDIILHV